MLSALTLLLLLQLIGEVFVQFFALPVPGPVIGLVLLFAGLLLRGRLGDDLRNTANTLLQHLSLLFVPAGAGVMIHAGRVADEWLALGAALVGSTLLSMAATALTLKFFLRNRATKPVAGGEAS
ncbi:MAG: CidA/LrgA family protein [Rhodocyclaceae bacterium]